MRTSERPLSVSIISWILIVTSAGTVLYSPFAMKSPIVLERAGVSHGTLLLLSFLGAIVHLTAGFAMLKGYKWGRQLYLFVTPVFLLLAVALYNPAFAIFSVTGFALYALFLFLLTRPSVSSYFSPSAKALQLPHDIFPPVDVSETDLQSVPVTRTMPRRSVDQSSTGKRVGSIFLLCIGGLMLTSMGTIIGPLWDTGTPLTIVLIVYGILATVFIVPAIFLWGRSQWALLLGVLLISVGGILLLLSLSIYQLSSMKEFRDQLAATNPAMMQRMIWSGIVCGLTATTTGGLLLLLQRRKGHNDKG